MEKRTPKRAAIAQTNKLTEFVGAADGVFASERYRRLFESAPEGLLILDAMTREITDASKRAHDVTGPKQAENEHNRLETQRTLGLDAASMGWRDRDIASGIVRSDPRHKKNVT